jgi:hypothetical protein
MDYDDDMYVDEDTKMDDEGKDVEGKRDEEMDVEVEKTNVELEDVNNGGDDESYGNEMDTDDDGNGGKENVVDEKVTKVSERSEDVAKEIRRLEKGKEAYSDTDSESETGKTEQENKDISLEDEVATLFQPVRGSLRGVSSKNASRLLGAMGSLPGEDQDVIFAEYTDKQLKEIFKILAESTKARIENNKKAREEEEAKMTKKNDEESEEEDDDDDDKVEDEQKSDHELHAEEDDDNEEEDEEKSDQESDAEEDDDEEEDDEKSDEGLSGKDDESGKDENEEDKDLKSPVRKRARYGSSPMSHTPAATPTPSSASS